MHLFTRFNLNVDFLELDPKTWDANENYQIAARRLSTLKVVNDAAERGVALVTNFHSTLTHKPEQKQYLYKVVAHQCKLEPKATKN